MKQNNITSNPNSTILEDAREIIEQARSNAVRSVDFCRVQMYWQLGRRIFEEEQQGQERAEYGAYIIKTLAKDLEIEYGSGFGVRQLERARQFYRIYPIASTVRTQLNWSQYKMLISIPDPDKREHHNTCQPIPNISAYTRSIDDRSQSSQTISATGLNPRTKQQYNHLNIQNTSTP